MSRNNNSSEFADWSSEWMRFYSEIFGIKPDFSRVKVPAKHHGFEWAVACAKELGDKPLTAVVIVSSEMFPVWQYFKKLDSAVVFNERDPRDGSYIVGVRDRVEADEELKNVSANNIKERGISTITLLERLLLELFVYWKFKKHLDLQAVTLCTGSRHLNGDVPACNWYEGLIIRWFVSKANCNILRARIVRQ
jgi:hypothetical protein